tara:strand:- start:1179 stop:2144 length:966 start_codon:yes stop_codon:yes gene_type:complete
MKIVVTGGNGMVGSCIKDVIKYYEPEFGKHEFVFLNRSLNDSLSVDLTRLIEVEDFFSKNDFDAIIHLAADVGGLYKNLHQNVEMFHNNIMINENVLSACYKNNIHKGIFILSSCIYPCEPSKFPMDETMIHESPPHYSNEGYAYSKRMMHLQCKNYNKNYNTDYTCLVPVNLYGPYDNFHPENSHFIPNIMDRFFNNIKNNEICSAYGSGKPLRQFLYAPDFAYIIIKLIFVDIRPNNTLIICNDEEYSIREIVKTLSKIMEINFSDVQWDTSKSDGCFKKSVDNSLFKSLFPEYKFTNFSEGIIKTYAWYKEFVDKIRK